MNIRAPTEVVGDPPAEQQQAAEGERVRAHHPLPVGDRDVQRPLGRGSATMTTEASRTIMSWATAITASDQHRLGRVRRCRSPMALQGQ